MNINPRAIAFWGLGFCVGFLIAGIKGGVAGLAVTLLISIIL